MTVHTRQEDNVDQEKELRRRVGKRLRLARWRAELTQEQLAGAASVSRNLVSLIEHGALGGVDAYRLRRLALATGTTLAALFDDEPARQDGRQ